MWLIEKVVVICKIEIGWSEVKSKPLRETPFVFVRVFTWSENVYAFFLCVLSTQLILGMRKKFTSDSAQNLSVKLKNGNTFKLGMQEGKK